MTQPSVDVVIPAFNPGDLLGDAIASATAHAAVRRIIVVDDGSDPPIQPIDGVELHTQTNAGPSVARNRGIDATNADYVLCLDADDVLLDGLDDALHLAETLDAGAVVGGWIERPPRGDLGAGRHQAPPPEWTDALLPRPADVFRPINLFGASGLLIRRDVIDAGLRFDPDLHIGEDRELLRRIADHAPIAICAAPIIGVTIHPDDGTNLTSARHFDRRVQDFLAIVTRHHDDASDAYFEASARWLVNHLAKRGGSRASWTSMMSVCAAHGWRVPLKSRVRRLLRPGASSD